MQKRRVLSVVVLLLLGPAVGAPLSPATYLSVGDASITGQTLIETIRRYLNSSLINWTDNYFGLVFGKQSKTDFEDFIDHLANASDWANVLRWSVRLEKLGIEREQAIKDALCHLEKAGELPASGKNSALGNFWDVYERELLYAVYRYSEEYNYLTEKWNASKAYIFLKEAIATNGSVGVPSVFYVYGSGKVIPMSDRYYDENGQTASAYLIFYELGVTEALQSAFDVWNYVNVHHWSEQGRYFNYRPTSIGFECEAPFFFKVFSIMKWFGESANTSRLVMDLETRFLASGWESPQWRENQTGTVGYAVMHMNPSNSQRRLQNTLGAWFTLQGAYHLFDSSSQTNLINMIRGTNSSDPAWKLLYSHDARLYDQASDMFRYSSTDPNVSSEATSAALLLQALLGVVPINTTIVFPLEEYHYEYNYDIDPELFSLDVTNNILKIAVDHKGTLEFIYGQTPVQYSFAESGIYEINFAGDWNSIVNASKQEDLPLSLKLLRPPSVLPGDINGDGYVDIFDIVIVAVEFDHPPPPIVDLRADVNNDGHVNIFDIVVVALHFGETS